MSLSARVSDDNFNYIQKKGTKPLAFDPIV